jgi:hypothetical protein
MRTAILSESPADETAIEILCTAVLGRQLDVVQRPAAPNGWEAARNSIATVLRWLHYQRQADALIVVVDSDNSDIHKPQHNSIDSTSPKCRYCQIQSLIAQVTAGLPPIKGYAPVEIAVGVAAPSLEAWLCVGLDPACTEAGWILGKNDGKSAVSEIHRLKRTLYGTDRPSLAHETLRMIEEANRLVAESRLE